MKYIKKYYAFILAFVLGIIPFIHINVGVGLTDIGYNLANYENFPNVNATWQSSTFLSLLLGKLLTYLPFGHRMLGMTFYCTLIYSAVVIAVFFILRKYFNTWAVFAGELIAVLLSWCPKVILYHYLGYFLVTFAAILLCTGLVSESGKKVYYSGVILSLNILVRFPNIVQGCLIAVIIAYWIIEKKKSFKALGLFALGYGGTFAVQYFLLEVLFGKGAYMVMIHGLFGIQDANESYSPFKMLEQSFWGYAGPKKYVIAFLVSTVIFAIVLRFAKKKWMRISVYACHGFICLGVLRIMKYYGMFSFNFAGYDCFYSIAVIFIEFSYLVFASALFGRKVKTLTRLLAFSGIIVGLLSSLGSNNGLYTTINNLFLTAPLCFGILAQGFEIKKPKAVLSVTMAVLGAALIVNGSLFTWFFRFQDAKYVKDAYVKIENNDVLKGMKCNKDVAPDLEELSEYVSDNSLKERECIFYGSVPMLSYALEMPNGISHIWPRLDSYPYDDMKAELDGLGDELPVFIYSTTNGDLCEMTEEECTNDKQKLLSEFVRENYKKEFSNSHFTLCMPKQ